MRSSPYRKPAEPPEPPIPPAKHLDSELVPVFAVFWIGSIVRVVQGVTRGEPFGAELTLAAVAAAVLPLLVKDGALALLHRRRARKGRQEAP